MMCVKKPTDSEIRQTAEWDTWSREPGVFEWYYNEKETCYMLEGNARVTDKKGNTIVFGPGDWVEFEPGLACTWNIEKTIRKKYRFS